MSGRLPPIGSFGINYSTSSRAFYGPVPAGTGGPMYESPMGQFRMDRLPQSDAWETIKRDPIPAGQMLRTYDVSLDVLRPYAASVGAMRCGNTQLGSCTLIFANLAMIPCHCIEGLNVKTLEAVFGHVTLDGILHGGYSYQVVQVVEHDPLLDYAIVQLEGTPGITHGRCKIEPNEVACKTPALLHHPLNKPLKLSIHDVVENNIGLLSTYHDSDYGSSGGAYINPTGNMVALHLGSSRNNMNLNLERLALPLKEIFAKRPNGVLAYCAPGLTTEQILTVVAEVTYFITPRFRSFIDLEKYDQRKLHEGDYTLRPANGELPAVAIDSHQKKHFPAWPSTYSGGRGTIFNKYITIDDMVDIAEAFVNDIDLFKQSYAKKTPPNKLFWNVDKKILGKTLYNKLQDVFQIEIDPAYSQENNTWYIHFNPVLSR